jgi:lipopolysaccharide assembly protein A
MKYLTWLLKAAVFFTLFAFALNNQGSVQVKLFFGAHWQAPLVLVLLATLALGTALGMLVMVPVWLRAKRQPTAVADLPAVDSSTTTGVPATSTAHGL